MVTIILSACLISDPAVCKEHRLPLEINADVAQCAMHAPPHFARWEEDHPKWRVVRWRCQPGTQDDI